MLAPFWLPFGRPRSPGSPQRAGREPEPRRHMPRAHEFRFGRAHPALLQVLPGAARNGPATGVTLETAGLPCKGIGQGISTTPDMRASPAPNRRHAGCARSEAHGRHTIAARRIRTGVRGCTASPGLPVRSPNASTALHARGGRRAGLSSRSGIIVMPFGRWTVCRHARAGNASFRIDPVSGRYLKTGLICRRPEKTSKIKSV